MKPKATHKGHCQVCNRVHKLPGGKLAKHGYEILGGYFEGVCMGSGQLPLEQDTTYVVKSIEFAETRIAALQQQIELWSAPATTPEGWFHEYVHGAFYKYIWRRVQISGKVKYIGADRYFEAFFTDTDGKLQPLLRYSITGTSELDVATNMNQKYVEHLQKGVREMQMYIDAQQDRITSWHKQPLMRANLDELLSRLESYKLRFHALDPKDPKDLEAEKYLLEEINKMLLELEQLDQRNK